MRHYIMVNQRSNNDCAVACLMMILKYYKIKVNYEELKNELKTKEEGTTAYDIVKVSNKYGIKAIGYKKYKLEKIKEPVIALVINKGVQHFIVIYKVRKNSLIIADPTAKIMNVSKNYFKKYYSGIIIKFINKTPKKNYLSLILCYFIINILIIILNFILIYIISKLINIIEMQDYLLMKDYVVLLILLYVIKSIFIYIKDIFSMNIRVVIDKKVTLPFVYKLLSSNNKLKTNIMGSLMGKYNDLNYIKDLYFKFITIYLINFIFLIISLLILGIVNIDICLILIIYLFIIFLYNYKYYSKKYYLILENQNKKEKYFSIITEVFNNIKMIKNLRKEKYFYNKIKKEYRNYICDFKNIENCLILKDFFNNILFLLLLIILIFNIIFLDSNFSNVFYIYSLIMIIINIFDEFIYELPSFMSYRAIKERLRQIDDEDDKTEKIIERKTYNDKRILINSINEEKKSEILLNIKKEINNYTYINLEQNIFEGTIIDNIFMGEKLNKKILSICLINKIIKKYNLDYTTNINDNYVKVLREEKCKILIARGIANSHKCVVFDEVFDYLDQKEAVSILNDIKNFFPKLTIIVFSKCLCKGKIFNKSFDYKYNRKEVKYDIN